MTFDIYNLQIAMHDKLTSEWNDHSNERWHVVLKLILSLLLWLSVKSATYKVSLTFIKVHLISV